MNKVNTILLVDDDYSSNYLNQLLLEEMDIAQQIFTVTDGRQALDFLAEHTSTATADRPDLILLDLNMPVMDGFEFLKHYHDLQYGKNAHRLIVVLTSSFYNRDVNLAKDFNVDGYITKPLVEAELLEIIAQYPQKKA